MTLLLMVEFLIVAGGALAALVLLMVAAYLSDRVELTPNFGDERGRASGLSILPDGRDDRR
jgi:hypothetical protein